MTFVSAIIASFAFCSGASADPIVDHPVTGYVGLATHEMAAGASGSMWFMQGSAIEEMNEAGAIIANTGPLSGGYTELASAADGGAWALNWEHAGTGTVIHVAPNGEVLPVTTPPNMRIHGLAEGADGKVWILGCTSDYSSGKNAETCEALSVSPTGTVTAHPLPPFSHVLNTSENATPILNGPDSVLAGPGGVWMDLEMTREGRPTAPTEAVFITYSGTITPASLPVATKIIGLAGGDNAWWVSPFNASPNETPTLTIGQVTDSGIPVAERPFRQGTTDPLAALTLEPGRGGNLLWAEQTPMTLTSTGAMGTITLGGETRLTLPFEAAAVPPPTPFGATVGSGNCNFGNDLYQASNGNIWAVSGGHPTRLSALTPAGEFSTFLPFPPTTQDFEVSEGYESSTGKLWFAVDSASDGVNPSSPPQYLLAVANPLSPPPGVGTWSIWTTTTDRIGTNVQAMPPPVVIESVTVRTHSVRASRGVTLRVTLSKTGNLTVKVYRMYKNGRRKQRLIGSVTLRGRGGTHSYTIRHIHGHLLAAGKYKLVLSTAKSLVTHTVYVTVTK